MVLYEPRLALAYHKIKRYLLTVGRQRRKKWLGCIMRGESLMCGMIEGRMDGDKRSKVRKRNGMMVMIRKDTCTDAWGYFQSNRM